LHIFLLYALSARYFVQAGYVAWVVVNGFLCLQGQTRHRYFKAQCWTLLIFLFV